MSFSSRPWLCYLKLGFDPSHKILMMDADSLCKCSGFDRWQRFIISIHISKTIPVRFAEVCNSVKMQSVQENKQYKQKHPIQHKTIFFPFCKFISYRVRNHHQKFTYAASFIAYLPCSRSEWVCVSLLVGKMFVYLYMCKWHDPCCIGWGLILYNILQSFLQRASFKSACGIQGHSECRKLFISLSHIFYTWGPSPSFSKRALKSLQKPYRIIHWCRFMHPQLKFLDFEAFGKGITKDLRVGTL